MGRQLFLHHYLPAHLASALVTGALIEFIFNLEPAAIEQLEQAADQADGKPAKKEAAPGRPVRERLASQSLLGAWAASGVILAVVIWCFLYYAPLTYGKPGLEVSQVQARKWLNYDLHFAK